MSRANTKDFAFGSIDCLYNNSFGNLICWIGIILTCRQTHIQFFFCIWIKCTKVSIYYILHIISAINEEGDSTKTRRGGISPPVVPCWKTKRWHDEEGHPSSPFQITKGRHHEAGTSLLTVSKACRKERNGMTRMETWRRGFAPSSHQNLLCQTH